MLIAVKKLVCLTMSGGRALLGGRRRGSNVWLRSIIVAFVVLFVWLQLMFASLGDTSDAGGGDYNDSMAAILSMVPSVLHKFLTPRPRNSTGALNGSAAALAAMAALRGGLNLSEIKRNIAQYNYQQTVYNEDIFGPLQNDSVVIVIQVF